MMKRLLTIAIPTYKRPELLTKALNSIGEQPSEVFSDVEVLVCDDSMVDINEHVFAKFKKDFPHIKLTIIHNEKNLGIDDNIVNCILKSSTEYVWLLGEDDLICNNSLLSVLNIIAGGLPFYMVNYQYCSGDYSQVAHKAVLNIDSQFDDRVIDFCSFAEKYLWAIGFIGACVINREAWVCTDYQKFKGSFYSHVGGIIDASIGSNIGFVNDVCVLNRAEDVTSFTWSKSTFSVYFSFFDVLAASRLSSEAPSVFNISVKSCLNFFKIQSFGWLCAKKADGVFDWEIFKRFYCKKHSLITFKETLLAFLVLFVPKNILVPLRKYHLKKKFKVA